MQTEKKQTGALIDVDLYQRARAQALLERRRVGELISDAIRDYLEKRAKQPRATLRRTKYPHG